MIESQSSPSLSTYSGADARIWQIRNEQTHACLRTVPVALSIQILTCAIIVVGLWDVVPVTRLVIWGGVAMFLVALGLVAFIVYPRRILDPSSQNWLNVGTLWLATVGVVWGAAGVLLFPPHRLEHQVLLILAIGGLSAGAVPTLGAYLPWFYALFPVTVLPLAIRLLLSPEPKHLTIGMWVLVYAAGIIGSAHVVNRTFSKSLRLQFENADLAQELAVQRDEAERANSAKSKFLAAASHDLRQPLHALSLFTSALTGRVADPEVRRIVDNINMSVRALEKLFNALLDISRLDAEVLHPEFAHFHLRNLVQRLIQDYAAEVEAKGLTLACDSCDDVVFSDAILLERIMRNYLSNAIRYTDKGGIRIACVPAGNCVRIEVIDTGIGIAPAHQREIFDEFYQLGNPERDRNKGLGLGLAIVDRVARLLGHPIGVESAPGKGSCFSITVALGDDARVAPDVPDEEFPVEHLAGLLTVVVDDEASVREGMGTLLEQWGCRAVLAGSEDEAVELLRGLGLVPGAIVVDFRLRDDRTGIEAIERLRREFGTDLPALIVTGDTAAERLQQARAGNYQLIHKPLQPAMLRAFLRNARKHQRA